VTLSDLRFAVRRLRRRLPASVAAVLTLALGVGAVWPGADPIGSRLKWGGPDGPAPWVEVVGVVEDGRYRGLESVSLDVYVPY
jgi:peptidoglycan/LPS O-acetylase OafA/YrhL